MNVVFWTRKRETNGCYLKSIEGFPKSFRLNKGIPLTGVLPESASFAMDPDFPDNTLTPDCLWNDNNVLLISSRFHAFLQAKSPPPQVEYLPVTVNDHRGKALKPGYFLVNPQGTVPLLKLDQCDATMDPTLKSQIKSMNKFVVDDEVQKKAPPIFRLEHLPFCVMIAKDLAHEIEAAGFTGNRWIKPEAIADGKMILVLSGLDQSVNATV